MLFNIRIGFTTSYGRRGGPRPSRHWIKQSVKECFARGIQVLDYLPKYLDRGVKVNHTKQEQAMHDSGVII